MLGTCAPLSVHIFFIYKQFLGKIGFCLKSRGCRPSPSGNPGSATDNGSEKLACRNNIIKLFLEIVFGLVRVLCEWTTRICTTDVFSWGILRGTLFAQRQLKKENLFLYFYVTAKVNFSSKRPYMFQSLYFRYTFVKPFSVTWVTFNNLVRVLSDQEIRPIIDISNFCPWNISITSGQHQWASELGISAYNHLINGKYPNAQSNLVGAILITALICAARFLLWGSTHLMWWDLSSTE